MNNITNTEIIDFAVGDENNIAIFNDTRDDKINNSSGGGFITPKIAQTKNNYQVKIITLDTFFKSKYSVILNLNPDHLERHHTFKNYVNAKFKIIKSQNKNDYALIEDKNKRTI